MFLGTFTICVIVVTVIAACFLSFALGRFDAFDKGFDQGLLYMSNASFYKKAISADYSGAIAKEKIAIGVSKRALPSYLKIVK